MTTPISFVVRPPSAPHRPSPLSSGSGYGGANGRNGSRAGPPSRRLFEQGDEDEDEDEDGHGRSRGESRRDEPVEGFRNGRVHGSGEDRRDGPMVIPALPNRDWKNARRTPSYRPATPQAGDPNDSHERVGDEPQRSGLRFAIKAELEQNTPNGTTEVKAERTEERRHLTGTSSRSEVVTKVEKVETVETIVKSEPLTLEEQALQAILAGDATRETADEAAQRELVIQLQANRAFGVTLTEEQAFKRDIAALPEASTMEDFEAVPISAFGIAALRGMGWDPKSADNVKAREVQRRPQLLGLGATPLDTAIRPTHKGIDKDKAKDKKKSYAERTGRGFTAASLFVKKERERDGVSGSSTPVDGSSRRTSPSYDSHGSDSSRRRRRDEEDGSEESGRESKRREEGYGRGRDGDDYRDGAEARKGYDRRARSDREETDDERARRKARERERERNRDRERYTNGERERSRYGERDGERDRRLERAVGGDGDRRRDRVRD